MSLTLDVCAHGLEAIVGAAYLMTDVAFVRLDGDRASRLIVQLTAKAGQAADSRSLETRFRAELETQKVRWAQAKNNQALRRKIVERAVTLAEEGPR